MREITVNVRVPGRRRSRKPLAVLVLVLLTTALAGCGSDGSGSEKELTYWSLWQRKEPQAKVLADVIASFEKDTGINVNVEWQGRDNLTKVLGALHTDDVPDLVDQQYFTLYGVLVANDQFTDLGPVYDMRIPGEGTRVREVIPQAYDSFTTTEDGTQFMVPMEVIGYTLWYDQSRLPEVSAGSSLTWQEFTAVLAERKAAAHHPLALDGEIAGYAQYWLSTALQRELGPGGLRDLASQQDAGGWEAPEVVRAVENIAALVANDYFIPGYKGAKWPAIQNKWAQGEADFLFMGSWAPKETSTVASKGFEYRSLNFPASGGDQSVPASVIGFSIPKPAEHVEEARQFIAYLLGKKHLSRIATEADNLTARADIPAPDVLADVKKLIDTHGVVKINDGLDAVHADYNSKVLQPLAHKLLTGQLGAEQFVSEIKTAQQTYWENNG